MKRTTKKQIALLLVCCMLFTLLPTTALADTTTALTQSSTSIFAGGEGTSTSAYEIATLEQLEKFRDSVNNGNDYAGKYIKLTADIDVLDKVWTPIGVFKGLSNGGDYEGARPFKGTFNGAGHVIYNFIINDSNGSNGVGLFNYVASGGHIQNLGVAGTISVENSASNGWNIVGGVVGSNYGTIENCYNTGDVTGKDSSTNNVGGVVGRNDGTVRNCYNTGDVTGTSSQVNNVGGVIGYNNNGAIVRNSYNTGKVTSTGGTNNHVGGVVGFNYGAVENCYNIGELTTIDDGTNYVGRVVGININGTVQDCYYLGGTVAEGIGYGSGSATPLTAEEFKDKSNFNSWDLDTIWEMSNILYRPILRNNIEKAMPIVAFEKSNLIYDGTEQALITVSDATTGGTLLYKVNDKSYAETIPTGKDATTYSVYYYVNGGKYYHSTTPQSIEVTIAPKDITNAQITIGDSFTYNGQEQMLNDITVTVEGISDSLVKDKDYTITGGNSGTNADTYTLTIKGKGNFTGSASQTWGIAKATATITTAPAAKTDLIEKNEAQELITAGSANGGILQYKVDDGAYSADIPKAKDAGTYTVYYYVEGDRNHNDSAPQSIPVKIEAAKDENNNSSNNNYYGGGYYAPEQEEDKTEETAWNNPFTDVHESDWFYHAVKYAHQNKLFAGVSATEFAPNMPMSRGMLVTVLYRMAGSPAVDGDMPFVDVNSDAYYRNAILWAVQNNIVSGVADDLFAPDTNITREQIAIILYRFAQYCGYDTSVGEDTNILSYDDFTDINEYAVTAMQYAAGSGFLNGRTESTLNPQDTATRAEVAAILQRFIEGNK